MATPLTRSGSQFMLDGQSHRLLGYDVYQATSLTTASCGPIYSDAQLDQLFASIASSGANCIRTWFFQNLEGAFDRCLDLASKHNLLVIPTLTNQWVQCEPRPPAATAYISLGDGHGYRNRSWYEGGYAKVEYGQRLSFLDCDYRKPTQEKGDHTGYVLVRAEVGPV